VSVSLGNRESYSAWKYFLEDITKRGMGEPMLTVIDGCPGLNKAAEEVFLKRTSSVAQSTGPTTCWIKCWNRTDPR